MIKILIIIIAAIVSAVLYRMGGASGYDTKYRDVGCSIVLCGCIAYLGALHWTLILCFGLMWGALSTYWKKGPNARWYNWLLTGLGYSLAILPFVIYDGCWIGFLSRTIALSGLVMIWSEVVSNVVWEECGRGALIIITLPLLFI